MLEHIAVKLTMELVPLIRQSVWLLTVSTVHFPVLVVIDVIIIVSKQTEYKCAIDMRLSYCCLVAEWNLSDTVNFLLNGHLTKTDTYSVELVPAFLDCFS